MSGRPSVRTFWTKYGLILQDGGDVQGVQPSQEWEGGEWPEKPRPPPSCEVALGEFIPSSGRVENASPDTNAAQVKVTSKVADIPNACALRSVRTCRLTCHQALKVSRAYWDIRAAHCAGVVATTACTCLGAEG